MTSKLTRTTTAFVLALAMASGCALETNQGPHPVSKALPTADEVKIDVPDEQQLILGEIAETYRWTRQITRDLNGTVAFVLIVVHVVVQFPPTSIDGNTAIWGPHSDALDPAEWRLTVTELADGSYDWQLDGRSKTNDDGFLTLVSGNAVPGVQAGDDERGSGNFLMDFDAIHTVDPVDNPDAKGKVEVVYELENRDGTQATLDLHVDTREVDSTGAQVPIVADYHYGESLDGSGDFEFSWLGDIDEDGSLFEDARINASWLADGAGRADVSATGGDLGDGTAEFTQCWDTQFRSVYEDFEVPDGGAAEGDIADCAL